MEGQIKAERTTEDILQEVQAIINNTSKESFLEYLLKEGAAEENNYLFYCDFILDQIPELYFEHLVEMDINNYCIIHDEIIAKAAASYTRPTQEEIKQYKTFRTKEAGRSPSELIRLYPKRLEKIRIPVDKINRNLWNGNILDEYITSNDKNIFVSISLDFKDIGVNLSKELTSFDKLIYTLLATRYYSGETIINLNQIYKDMGNNGRSGKYDLNKINDSITKMGRTWLTMNNETELRAGFNYPDVATYESSLLHFERIKIVIKGKETIAINLLSEPTLMRFARERGQTSTIPIKILKIPINKSDLSIKLNDYLYTYVCNCKENKKLSKKITFKKICTFFNIPEGRPNRMKRTRLFKKIVIILNHYKSCGFIQDFSIDQNKDITFIV